MLKKVCKAIVLVSLPISTLAFAGPNLDAVKKLYMDGVAPAESTDFPERNYSDGSFVQPQGVKCAIIDGVDQPYGYDLARTIRVTPPYGPLVPGKTEEKLTFGDVRISYNLIANPIVDGTDLVVVNPIYRTWVDGDQGVNHYIPATLRARRSGEYVAFQVSIAHHSSTIQDEFYYGYCYPLGKALF